MVDKNDILSYLKELKPQLLKDGIEKIGLFGSYAKNSADEFSDIDIFIETNNNFVEKFGFYGLNYYDELKRKINKKFNVLVDLSDIASLKSDEKKEFLKGAISA